MQNITTIHTDVAAVSRSVMALGGSGVLNVFPDAFQSVGERGAVSIHFKI
jgi:hypothetical protein